MCERKSAAVVHGFSLIEVLIALVVISIGLLGLAGLHLQGMKSNQDSLSRTQAILFAGEITEEMRANPSGVIGLCYDGFDLLNSSTRPVASGGTGCKANTPGCCQAQWLGRANGNFTAWNDMVTTAIPALPGMNATIACNTISTDARSTGCSVTVVWYDNMLNANATWVLDSRY